MKGAEKKVQMSAGLIAFILLIIIIMFLFFIFVYSSFKPWGA